MLIEEEGIRNPGKGHRDWSSYSQVSGGFHGLLLLQSSTYGSKLENKNKHTVKALKHIPTDRRQPLSIFSVYSSRSFSVCVCLLNDIIRYLIVFYQQSLPFYVFSLHPIK